MGARLLSLVSNIDVFHHFGWKDECNTGPNVSSNPMHHPKSPQSKDTKKPRERAPCLWTTSPTIMHCNLWVCFCVCLFLRLAPFWVVGPLQTRG